MCCVAECIDNVAERRTKELANTLGMLRSASLIDGDDQLKPADVSHGGWKVIYLSSVIFALAFSFLILPHPAMFFTSKRLPYAA